MAAHITSLCVRLNACPCVVGHDCKETGACNACRFLCKRGRDSPLELSDDLSSGVDILARWVEQCDVLRQYLQPTSRLSIICDCKDIFTAEKVVKPMRNFPKLTQCSIRLGRTPDIRLRRLAEETVREVTRESPARYESAFRFEDLPSELQRRILWQTDLVAPQMLEYVGFRARTYKYRMCFPHLKLLGHRDNTSCLRCKDSLEACCCLGHHAAFSSFSSISCNCWRFPSALFLINKNINRQATELFFSRNKFVSQRRLFPTQFETVDPSAEEIPVGGRWCTQRMPKIRANQYLMDHLTPRALQHLRWIRFKFQRVEFELMKKVESERASSWQRMMMLVNEHCRIGLLTIELDISEESNASASTNGENVVDMYQRIVGSLGFSHGLKDFFLHLPVRGIETWLYFDDSIRAAQEQRLEKEVMGSKYDSTLRGKLRDRGLGGIHEGLE